MKTTIESLYTHFENRDYRFGNDILIPLAYCNEFIELCRKQHIAILGLEGFSVKDGQKRVPNLDEIADFSSIRSNGKWQEFVDTTTLSAKRFIRAMDSQGVSDGYSFILKVDNTT